jgi:subtilisin family serine protease
VSPRLPSGAVLALTAAMTAAAAIVAALPASAGAAAPGRFAAGRAGTASRVSSDRIRTQEWWLANLHVPQAWQFSRGTGITVAVLSSGVDAAHPDLTGSVVTGPDRTGSGAVAGVPSWEIGGTSAASLIAGHGDNVGRASGIIGIAPAARILSLRVILDATDPLNANPADVRRLPAAIAAGIRYAAAHGAQVIDLPLDPASLASDGAATGGLGAATGGSAAERAAVSYALGKGAVLVAPAGDNGEDGNQHTFPASYPGVIAVGAVDRHFVRAAFSTRQSFVTLTAPGVNLTTASPPSGYRNMSTTDAASAIVAGVAALIRSRYPHLNESQVRQALLAGSVARPPSATVPGDGRGTVDALKAIQAAALIAAPRAAASAPSTSPVTGQAPPGKTRPAAGHPETGILGRAKTVLRDAALAAGLLIVLLVVLLIASLLGIRLRRRRSERGPPPAREPRTLLSTPSGPLAVAGGAGHTSADRHERAAAAHMAAPGTAPWRTGSGRQDWRSPAALPGAPPAPASGPPARIRPTPGAPPFAGTFAGPGIPRPGSAVPGSAVPGSAPPGGVQPGGRSRRKRRNRGRSGGGAAANSRISAHGMRVRVTPASRTVTRAQLGAPGGPPWEPAPMPEGDVQHGLARRVPDPVALFALPPAPATPAPWEEALPLQRRGPAGPISPADSAGPVPPVARLRSGGPVPSAEPRPANPVVPPPAQPETPAAVSGQPGVPADPPGTTPPSGPSGSGPPQWRRSLYPGRHTSGTGSQGPQPAVPGPGDTGSSPGLEPGDAPSGPLYIWNPAALTEPFPSVRPPDDAGRPGEGTEDTGNPAP